MRRMAVSLAVSCGSIVILAVLAEVALRTLHPPRFDWRVMVWEHPVRELVLAPNFDGYFLGTRVRTNEFGHRVPTRWDKRYSRDKPPGVKRVLVFGDSFAFGDECAAEDSFPEQLQQALDPGFSRIQVLNLGVPAYNPFQEWNYIEESALAFEPDVVVLQFTETNDLEPLIPHSEQTAWKTLKGQMRRHLYLSVPLLELYGKVTALDRDVWLAPPAPDAFAARLRRTAAAYYHERQSIIERNELGWQQAEQSYRETASFLNAHQVPLVIVVLVASWDVECRAWNCTGVTTTFGEPLAEGQEFFKQLDRAVGGLTPYYISMARELAPYSLQSLAEGRGHYGPKKNRIVAQRLETVLRNIGIAGTQ